MTTTKTNRIPIRNQRIETPRGVWHFDGLYIPEEALLRVRTIYGDVDNPAAVHEALMRLCDSIPVKGKTRIQFPAL